jgi:hypothetical protein
VTASSVETRLPEVRGEFLPDEAYFRSRTEPFGRRSLFLRIGPLGVHLEGMSESQAVELENRFSAFVESCDIETASAGRIRIRVGPAGVDHFLRLREDGEPEIYRMGSRVEGGRLTLWSYEFAGWVDASRRLAQLSLVRDEGHLFERGLENFLRVVTASFVLDQGGLLLHAAGIVRGGRAYIFFGPSGSGKTTVTRLSPDDLVLSDDMTLLVPNRGRYEAAGIPFGMAHHRVSETSGSFPVASLNRLVQSREVRRERLGRARALAEVVSSLPFVTQRPTQATQAVEVAARALESMAVYRLHFRKDDTFWSVVEES